MLSKINIQNPITIAKLPQPLNRETGKVQFGDVWTQVAGKKRKRHEIAVAIDGEGINVYNVYKSIGQTPN